MDYSMTLYELKLSLSFLPTESTYILINDEFEEYINMEHPQLITHKKGCTYLMGYRIVRSKSKYPYSINGR